MLYHTSKYSTVQIQLHTRVILHACLYGGEKNVTDGSTFSHAWYFACFKNNHAWIYIFTPLTKHVLYLHGTISHGKANRGV